MRKVKDLAVKVGSYTDNQGNTKGRYVNVGALMEGDNGQFLFINRHFNPAGCPAKDGAESIIVSMFDIKDASGGNGGGQSKPAQQQSRGYGADLDDDVPF